MNGAAKNLDLEAITAFLGCATPDSWVQEALRQQSVLLVDHANCEKKAAQTALALIHRYPQHDGLLLKLSKLAREELRHFEQVVAVMRQRDVEYVRLSASRYAQSLHEGVRRSEPGRLIDTLIVGALIEARSCERFAALAPSLDGELKAFYCSLLKSEARHFTDYLKLAESLSAGEELSCRLALFRQREAALICEQDSVFRFHSGRPC